MDRSPARPQRRSLLAVALALLLTLPPACVAVGGRVSGPQVTVMTRNLYLGSSLRDLVGVSSLAELVPAAGRGWAEVVANDFPARAGPLADEIAHVRPDVLGLQEVALFRDQAPSDIRTHPGPNAGHVVLDLLAILLAELRARGTPYTAVATSQNADIEAARMDAAGALVDLRVTDRDVILVRADRVDAVGNPLHGHYRARRVQPSWPVPIVSLRGWTSIDLRAGPGTTVRVINTHLEVAAPDATALQERQAEEARALIAGSPYPVIALGDFNSASDGSTTGTYDVLTAVLDDAWTAGRPAGPGATCCQAALLDNPSSRARLRIDLVLAPEDWPVTDVARTGAEPFRAAPAPLWASDHAGVTARFTAPRRRPGGRRVRATGIPVPWRSGHR